MDSGSDIWVRIMSELVFAYGSNMCSGRFRDYGVSPEGAGRIGFLAGYRLVFNKFSRRDGSGKGNVEPSAGSEVGGVLYSLSDAHLLILDNGEGAGYRRSQLPIRTENNENVQAWVHIAVRPSHDPSLRPYSWYKRFLVEGAKEHSLPVEYIQKLEQIEAVDDRDEQRNGQKRELTCGE